jgi:hypothetical protein
MKKDWIETASVQERAAGFLALRKGNSRKGREQRAGMFLFQKAVSWSRSSFYCYARAGFALQI